MQWDKINANNAKKITYKVLKLQFRCVIILERDLRIAYMLLHIIYVVNAVLNI